MSLARKLVTEFGFSEKVGFIRYNNNQEEVFLGHSVTQRKNVSDGTAQLIDEEIKRLIEEANNRARKIIQDNIDDLHTLAKGLLEYETLSGEDIKALLAGESITRNDEPVT